MAFNWNISQTIKDVINSFARAEQAEYIQKDFYIQKEAVKGAVQPENYQAVDLSTQDYVNSNAASGFFIWISDSEVGKTIKAQTQGGQDITKTIYTTGVYFRDARFQKVYRDGTTATNLEAWY